MYYFYHYYHLPSGSLYTSPTRSSKGGCFMKVLVKLALLATAATSPLPTEMEESGKMSSICDQGSCWDPDDCGPLCHCFRVGIAEGFCFENASALPLHIGSAIEAMA
mmetsp:Transcript_45009/g.74701  ORF Transcript_45009/g.74701 Transcript_45009/m.74701 type:complete len:107 (-) Transcript_45009:212-532(-)